MSAASDELHMLLASQGHLDPDVVTAVLHERDQLEEQVRALKVEHDRDRGLLRPFSPLTVEPT